jgi:basic membrane protein A
MKKNLLSVLGLTALLGSMLLVGCEPTTSSSTGSTSTSTYSHESYTPSYSTSAKKIALVTDVGSIDDKSFNQGTWEGIKAYADAHELVQNTNYKYFQPAGGESAGTQDYVNAINSAITWGAEIVVCPGFLFEPAIYQVQELHKNVAFVLIDGTPNEGDYKDVFIAPNTVSVLFKEQESGFLAGYAAVKEGKTSLGFMGGMAVPAVIRYGVGYVAGAYQAAKEMGSTTFTFDKDYYKYLGTFGPAPAIKTEAQSWYNAGVQTIFAAAGGAGSSVMSAAAELTDKWMIGVDVDQSNDSATVLTSAMKGLGAATVAALESFYSDGFKVGGTQMNLGAKEDGVQIPTAEASWRFQTFTSENYEEVYAKLVDGSIVVPTDYASLKSFVEGLGLPFELTQAIIGA